MCSGGPDNMSTVPLERPRAALWRVSGTPWGLGAPQQFANGLMPSGGRDGSRGVIGHPKFCGLVVSAASLPFDLDS